MQNDNEIKIYCASDWVDYEMLDTGEGEKLERFGNYKFVRPLEDAIWEKSLNKGIWDSNDGVFLAGKSGAKAGWEMKNKIDKKWEMSYKDISFFASPTSFRHLSFFPEQANHWDFIENKIKNSRRKIKFLNLFGYTGVASLFALKAGAEVVHVDASKQSLDFAKENQKLSKLEDLPMRFILDDCVKFIEREVKRGNKYDCIVMDPPKFGRGPKGEIWKLEEELPKLLELTKKLLSDNPLFVIITSYSTLSSSLTLGYSISDAFKNLGGKVEQGELCVLDKSKERPISFANTAIWSR